MTTIRLESNIREVSRKLTRIQRKQIPFAASQALNDTAFKIRNDTVTTLWPRSVQVKQRNFARAAFRVRKSTKRDLVAAVFDQLNRAFMPRQIEGGVKVPFSSTHIAVPTKNALTGTGRIKKAARLSDPSLFKARIKGTFGLWKRTRRNGVQLFYVLTPKANVRPAFPFFEFGIRSSKRNFGRFLRKRLVRAIKTAR